MKKYLILALCLASNVAMAEDAKPNRFQECVQKWRDAKAQEGFKAEKGQYKAHMSVCLRKEKGPSAR